MIHPNTLPVETVWELWKGRPEPIVQSEVYRQKFLGYKDSLWSTNIIVLPVS